MILLIQVIFPILGVFYIATEFFLVVFQGKINFHSSVQPYQKRWHNVLDTIIFGNLVIINGFSMFMYISGTSHSYLFFTNNFVQTFQLILIYWPMFLYVGHTQSLLATTSSTRKAMPLANLYHTITAILIIDLRMICQLSCAS